MRLQRARACAALLLLPLLVATASAGWAGTNSSTLWKEGGLAFLLGNATLPPAPPAPRLVRATVTATATAAAVATAAAAVSEVEAGRQALVVPPIPLPETAQPSAAARPDAAAALAEDVAPLAAQAVAAAGPRKLLRSVRTRASEQAAARKLQAWGSLGIVANNDKFIRANSNKFLAWSVAITTNASLAFGDAGTNGAVLLLSPTTNVLIHAWRVTIVDRIEVPGMAIQISAREIACQPAPGSSACWVSASGGSGQPYATAALAGGARSRTSPPHGNNGDNGAAGVAGANGGSVSIYSELFDARIQLLSKGGAGGPGQVGGNGGDGITPSPPADSNCQAALYSYCEIPGSLPCSTSVCMKQKYVGLMGNTGGKGGNAGANGANGKGGNGGALLLRYVNLTQGVAVAAANAPGQGGYQTVKGTAGAGAAGSVGALSSYRWTSAATLCGSFWCTSAGSERGPTGQSGASGTVPALPARGSTGATATLDARGYSSVSQLGMPVSQTFLQLLLRQMRVSYISGDLDTAAAVGKFITNAASASTSCTSNSAGLGSCVGCDEKTLCSSVVEQATMLNYRLAQRLDVFGNPRKWVPTLGLSVIQSHLDNTVLPTLKAVEEQRTLLYSASATQAQKLEAVQQAINQLNQQMDALATQEAAMSQELSLSVEMLQTELEPLKDKYYAEVLQYQAQWTDAIRDKQASDRLWLVFQTVSDFATFVGAAIGVAEDPSGLGDAAASLQSTIADVQSLADPPAPVEVFLPLEDTTPAGAATDWAQMRGTFEGAFERKKLLVKQEQLSKLLDEYADLPGALEFRQAVAAYSTATQAYNELQYKIQYLWSSLMQSQKDRAGLQAMIGAAQTKVQGDQDPTLPETLSAVFEAYEVFRGMAMQWIYYESAAYRYASLKTSSSLGLNLGNMDSTALQSTHATLANNIVTDLNSNTVVEQLSTFPLIELSAATLANFSSMVASGTLSFVLPVCHEAFMWQSHVKVASVAVTVQGATVRPQYAAALEVPLTVDVLHSGSATLLDTSATRAEFAHLQRSTQYQIDMKDSSRVYKEGVVT